MKKALAFRMKARANINLGNRRLCVHFLPYIRTITRNTNGRNHWYFYIWQGKKASNPRPTVLETAALPAELFPYLVKKNWWTVRDSNPGPTGYEPVALPTELTVQISLKILPSRYRDGNTVSVAPPVGFEPTTLRLTAACSTC